MSTENAVKLTAIRGVFTALFDAVAVMSDFDEGKWEDLIAAFNAAGRLVFGWPHLISREEDLLGAIDALTDDFEATKAAIEQTTKEARIVMHELHEAIGPEPPPDQPPEGGVVIPTVTLPMPDAGSETPPVEATSEPVPTPTPSREHTAFR